MEYDYHKECPMCAEEIPLTGGEYSWSIYAFKAAGIMIPNGSFDDFVVAS